MMTRHMRFKISLFLLALTLVPMVLRANTYVPNDRILGKKRVFLYSNFDNSVQVLTQQMMPLKSGNNTIYVIRGNYRIDTNIKIPENCVLLFDGGSIVGNHDLYGQDSYIIGELINVFSTGVSFSGNWFFQTISPDWFIGNDIEKLQKAVDVSISNRSPQITIDRSYNLTGGTIYVDRGLHSKDEISKWSRRNLIFTGSGEGRLIKEDVGFMFSAKSTSIDFEFDRIHFRGYISNPSNLATVKDMYVFDCRYLGNIRVVNCTFCHCGCVYYQSGGVSTPMQGVLSIGNQYMKNKCVMRANECWHPQFIGDAIEDGITFIKGEKTGSNIRDLKITNSCVEGFYYENTAAIDLNCNAQGLSITDTYFEANYCSIKIPRFVTGIVTGNTFHSRGSFINKEVELHCMELARLENLEITANNIVVDDEKMILFYFDTSSPYYSQSQILYGNNGVAGKSKMTNFQDKVKNLRTLLEAQEKTYVNDITVYVKKEFPQIKSGKIIISTYRGMTTISVSNLVVSSAINSGTYSGHTKESKTFNQSLGVNTTLVDKDKNLLGLLFVTSSGDIGLRISQAGTYSGTITYPHG